MMKLSDIIPEDFIDEFVINLNNSGGLVKGLIKNSKRIFLNLPKFGTARKISTELKSEPFSVFYIFERTLSHKLHPVLYKINLNFFTNSRIEKHFYKKYGLYEHLVPDMVEDKSDNIESRMENFIDLKKAVTEMVRKDGHFMAVKFYDYVYSLLDVDLYRIIRPLEFNIIFIKKRLTDDRDKNLVMIKEKFQEFKDRFNEGNGGLFIERMKWDEELKDYCNDLIELSNGKYETSKIPDNEAEKIEDEQDSDLNGGFNEQEDSLLEKEDDKEEDKIDAYEEFKKWILSKDVNEIQQCLNGTEEKYGSSIEIGVLNKLFNDNEFREIDKEVKKEFIRHIHNTKEKDENRALKGKFNYLEKALLDQLSNHFEDQSDDQPAARVNSADDEGLKFEIEEENADSALVDLVLSDNDLVEIDENTEPVKDDEDFDTSLDNIEGLQEEIDRAGVLEFESNTGDSEIEGGSEISPQNDNEEELGKFLIAQAKTLEDISGRFSERFEKAEDEINAMGEIKDTGELSSMVIKVLNSEIYDQSRPLIIDALKKPEDEGDLFIKIIRYLEDGPFKVMTVREKRAIIDVFIEKYKDNAGLVQKLESYKKSLSDTGELLNIVFQTLSEIEKKYPNEKACISEQLEYLKKLLEDNEYEPIRKTIESLYINIINPGKEAIVRETFEKISEKPLYRQVDILNHLMELHRVNKQVPEIIESQLGSEKFHAIAERMKKEDKGKPLSMEDVLKEITGEEIDPAEWVETVTRIGEGITPETEKKPEEDESVQEKTGGLQDDIKNYLVKKDWTVDENPEDLLVKVDNLIKTNSVEAIKFLELLQNSDDVDVSAKQVILDKYSMTDDPLFQHLHDFHRMTDSADSLSEKQEIIKKHENIFASAGLSDILNPSLDKKRHYIQKEAENMDLANRFLGDLDDVPDKDKVSFLKEAAGKKQNPEQFRKTTRRLISAVEENKFKEAINSITSSSHSPEMKIKFLETLAVIARNKGWITEDINDKTSNIRKNTIRDKIDFYKRFIDNSRLKKRNFKKNIQEKISEPVKGRGLKEAKSEHDKSKKKKKIKKNTSDVEIKENLEGEKVYQQTLNIINKLCDNIDILEPMIGIFQNINSEEFQQGIKLEFQKYNNTNKSLINEAVKMVKSRTPDEDLLDRVQNSKTEFKFLWGEALKNSFKADKLEDVFKAFKNDDDYYKRIMAIVGVINRNYNVIKDIINKEKEIVEDIRKNLNKDELIKLRKKQRKSRDRDLISMFIDLVKLTGDLADSSDDGESVKAEIKEKSGEYLQKDEPATDAKKEEQESGKELNKGRIINSMEHFLKLCKSDRLRHIAVKDNERVAIINSFLNDLSNGSENALDVIQNNHDDCTKLFSNIIRYKFSNNFPSAGGALKYCLENNIINRSEL